MDHRRLRRPWVENAALAAVGLLILMILMLVQGM